MNVQYRVKLIRKVCIFQLQGSKLPEAKKRHQETHQMVETFTKWMWINMVSGSVGLFALEAFLMLLFDYPNGQYSMNFWHLPYPVK